MTDLPYLSAVEAARQIRAKELSPVDYVDALLARIEKLDPQLNAFLRLMPDEARAAAQTAEAKLQAGEPLGPLHGVPFGLKDIIDVAGVPTTAHSRILADNVAEQDAFVTDRIKAAGGILLGKLSTHEFAIGGPSFDLPWPPARNPWDRTMFPGGSSSGSGAALAAGFVPLALGTDTGGSVRNPASMCGLVGMKATYGRVSRRGVVPLSFSLDHVGPLTRTVAENALLLNVIAGHDEDDPASARTAVPDFSGQLGQSIKGMKVGVIRHFFTRDLEAAPEMIAGIDAALDVLANLGAEISEATTRPLADYAACNRAILLSEAYTIHEKWLQERPGDYGALTRQRILPGAFLRAVDYVDALRRRGQLKAAFDRVMESYDVIVTASSMEPAFPIEDAQASEKFYPRQARPPFNVTGSPALALPIGFTDSGLPLSMQIVGKPFDEATVYRVAHAYEQETNWHERHPPLDG